MYKYVIFLIAFFSLSLPVHGLDFTSVEIPGDTAWSWGVDSADVDNDGDIDIAVANLSAGNNRLWLNDGLGNFTAKTITGFGRGYGIRLADLDLDGHIDIVVSNVASSNPLRVYYNNGSGDFSAAVNLYTPLGSLYNPLVIDIDNDNDMDIYVSEQNNGRANLLLINNGSNIFTPSNIPGDTTTSISAAIEDFDGDGDLDIYSVSFNGQNKLYINDGLGNGGASFTASNIAGDITNNAYMARAVDIDNDGDIDIYSMDAGAQNKLYINDGLGNGGASFTASDITGDVYGTEAALKDFNEDGDIDIYTSLYEVQSFLWVNDGLGNGGASFTNDPIVPDDFPIFGVTANDFDGDGYLDIYLGAYAGGQNKLWFNDYTPPPTPSNNSSSKKGGALRKICGDPQASNYNPTRFGRHWPAVCIYEKEIIQKDMSDKDSEMCTVTLDSYVKKGDTGDMVLLIQTFLNNHLDTVNITPDGIFGNQTEHAVNVFQQMYATDILTPWNLTQPTGRWYQSTRKKANEILGCDETKVYLDNGRILD
jgi:hypothetical protein